MAVPAMGVEDGSAGPRTRGPASAAAAHTAADGSGGRCARRERPRAGDSDEKPLVERVHIARGRRAAAVPGAVNAGDGCRHRIDGVERSQRPDKRGESSGGFVIGRCRARAASAGVTGRRVAAPHGERVGVRCISHVQRRRIALALVLDAKCIGVALVVRAVVAGGGRSKMRRVQAAAEGEVHHRGDGHDDVDETAHDRGSRGPETVPPNRKQTLPRFCDRRIRRMAMADPGRGVEHPLSGRVRCRP